MMQSVPAIRRSVRIPLRLKSGITTQADFLTFAGLADDKEHVAVRFLALKEEAVPLVRLHSECLTGDIFGSRRCDCGQQLDEAMDYMAQNGGIILYLRQEGRGIGLYNKIDAYALQIEQEMDTFAANTALGHAMDERSYTVAAQMLTAMGIRRIRLLSNNPDKAVQLTAHGIDLDEQVPTQVYLTNDNAPYLQAKKRAGHKIKFHE